MNNSKIRVFKQKLEFSDEFEKTQSVFLNYNIFRVAFPQTFFHLAGERREIIVIRMKIPMTQKLLQ